MRIALVLLPAVLACGRVRFDPYDGDASGFEGTIGDDGRRAGANLAFVTRNRSTGTLGGIAGADMRCAQAAAAAGWSGTFIAFVSDANTDARDRIAGSRGWVRVDGAPVIDTVDAWLDGSRMFSPLDRDELGARVVNRAWTGTLETGRRSTSTCGNWTGAGLGASGNTTSTMSAFSQNGNYGCSNVMHHLYCFEIGRTVEVMPVATTGRLAFISSRGRTQMAQLLSDLDAVCQSDAMAAGRQGTYLAAAATSTATIASRFVADARPWVRPDGTLVAIDSASLFSGAVTSFVNQLADGTYVADLAVVTGAARPDLLGDVNCADWSGFNNGALSFTGYPEDASTPFWNGGPGSGTGNTSLCNDTTTRVLCLQE